MNIKKQCIIDERDQRIAVPLDIETFEKIEETLENFACFSLMNATDKDEHLSFADAKAFGRTLALI